MPLKTLQKFSVSFLSILNEKGRCDERLKPRLSPKELRAMYEMMVLTRAFDEKAFKLQRQGRLGTYASVRGQEAAQIGSAFALQDSDWVFPAFRENGVFLAKGFPMEMLYQYWGGDERGMKIPDRFNFFTVAVPVGTQTLHAVGCAMAATYKKEKSAVIVYLGDGATSEGDFHEAMNFAGTFKAPVVFLCQNNQWAISLPVSRQTAAETLAQKALAYGFDGIRVDGNALFAVYKGTNERLHKYAQA